MNSATLKITIRAIGEGTSQRAKESKTQNSKRYSFWANAIERAPKEPVTSIDDERSIDALEAKLQANFGEKLRETILNNLRKEIRNTINNEFVGYPYSELLWDLRRRIDKPGELTEILNALESHSSRLASITGYQQLLQREASASSLNFGVKIQGYSSLNLLVAVNNLEHLLDSFDANLSVIAPILTPFVAQTFAELFCGNDASLYLAEVSDDIKSLGEPNRQQRRKGAESNGKETATSFYPPLKDGTKLLWMMANGSLILPFVLALYVLWCANNDVIESAKHSKEIESKSIEALVTALSKRSDESRPVTTNTNSVKSESKPAQ